MAIILFDSLTRTERELRPGEADGIFRFYNCGPTVYAAAHIGNFRTFVINDLLRRLLELEFGPNKVRHVRNVTDIDDKTIRRARDEGRPLEEITKTWTDKFHDDCAALNCLPPHVEPAATTHIPEQIDMIAILERKGHAYRTEDGSVYFKVSSFEDYGALSRLKERELKQGTSLSGKPQAHDADEKEDGSDFALWKSHKPEDGDTFWPSPWGKGRPGWHIECSAMSKKHLGETIDLHTGGVDLLFPHHENEIAQSQCCNGTTFARHWYHSEHLLVDGKKMSKSLGNLYTLDQLREKGHSPAALRYALLTGHPRKQLSFTLESLTAAEKALTTLRNFRAELLARGLNGDHAPSNHFDGAIASLNHELNTPAALGHVFSFINQFNANPARPLNLGDLAAFDRVIFALGLDLTKPEATAVEIPPGIAALAEQRWIAKQAKDWSTADRLRADIAATGWLMKDRKDGYDLEPARS